MSNALLCSWSHPAHPELSSQPDAEAPVLHVPGALVAMPAEGMALEVTPLELDCVLCS